MLIWLCFLAFVVRSYFIMRERLLNPKNIKEIDLLSLKIITFLDEQYRVFKQTKIERTPYGCQCYKDCNCSDNYGKEKTIKKVWFRNIKFDDTDKCFYSEPYTPEYNYVF